MSNDNDYEGNPLYREALEELHWAVDEGYAGQRMRAIDNLISVRLALMMEQLSDRANNPSKANLTGVME